MGKEAKTKILLRTLDLTIRRQIWQFVGRNLQLPWEMRRCHLCKGFYGDGMHFFLFGDGNETWENKDNAGKSLPAGACLVQIPLTPGPTPPQPIVLEARDKVRGRSALEL